MHNQKNAGPEAFRASRRSLLAGFAASGMTGLAPWAEAVAAMGEAPVAAAPADLLAQGVKVVNTYHEIHCHGQCMLKAHVKDGRLLAITSAGDVPRCESAGDESIGKMQRRACMKGYAERKRVYAPDRLKYPLVQTIERGNVNGFKRVTWDEALDRACAGIEKARARQKELGYIPCLELGATPLAFMGPYVSVWGHHSAGNQNDALFNALGKGVNGSPAIDMLNSKFIIVWSADPQTTSPHLPFIMTKAREKGIPIVVIDTRFTGTAGAMGTGAPGIPAWICPRPATDSAILVAMANTIYRRGLHDEKFLRDYCFGFYPGDSVTSQSPAKDPVTGEPWKGRAFSVPAGQSFVEYLDEMNARLGGEAGVIRWAAELSGVPAQVIEALAVTYARTKPACIYSNWTAGGAQRTGNGMYYTWLMLCLAAMTGNVTVRGGGIGSLSPRDGMNIKMGKAPALGAGKKHKALLFSQYMQSKVLMTGRDSRT
ncbi:MAG: molybdopterin-dependent oxidoreductase, partial [Duodenibacillus sp.]|nr:molybdopterin-dependent oxidoreductase [Duodenibacillus sp.]